MADLHTKVSGARPPNRTKFFRFYICFHLKAPVLEVGTPSNEGWRPPTGNPGSAPAIGIITYTIEPFLELLPKYRFGDSRQKNSRILSFCHLGTHWLSLGSISFESKATVGVSHN